ncbi:unnamed protein product [Lecanosticta acicola]|uniref:Unnamed protein product n=1 Tax=Lecanosticta acicola TaxID=111012 RepID=A0AAI9EE08_9PEZI|nr:unnamed protein product [Lecanosticta acicola]
MATQHPAEFRVGWLTKTRKGKDEERRRWRKVDSNIIKLLHLMFDHLNVPYHRAPGEAEAECARLQQLGIVDAVWSDDGDSFMFGCTTLIKAHKVGGQRINDYVRIYQASRILEQHNFDADSFVLFALLAGGDYDKTGLRGCGPSAAKVLSRREFGIATSLRHVDKHGLPAWRDSLVTTSQQRVRKAVEVPSDFPNFKALEGYRNPAVSTDEQCHDLPKLRNNGWNRPIVQPVPQKFLRAYHGFWTRGFLKHFAPVFLVRTLAGVVHPDQKEENRCCSVRLKSGRQRKDLSNGKPNPEVKIIFKPKALMEIDLETEPSEEDWSIEANKDGGTYGPTEEIECEVLECFLQHGLPEGSWEPVTKSRRGTQRPSENGATSSQEASVHDYGGTTKIASKKRRRTSEGPADGALDTTNHRKNRAKARKDDALPRAPSGSRPAKKKKKGGSNVEANVSQSPPPAKFRHMDIPEHLMRPNPISPATQSSSMVIDLCSDGDDDDDDEEDKGVGFATVHASSVSLPSTQVATTATTSGSLVTHRPTGSSDPRALSASQPACVGHCSGTGSVHQSLASSENFDVPAAATFTQTLQQTAEPFDGSELMPGEAIDRATLRALRAAALHNRVSDVPPAPVRPHLTSTSPKARHGEVIDLT